MTDALFIACVLLVAAGAALIYLPAGMIAGGLLGGLMLALHERGSIA